ncbi:MAG: siderophore-interacting protein [Alphaproteobacteria bacterium]|nr:siderophore-interacting protein [Alphaproteobacteria bacterium]
MLEKLKKMRFFDIKIIAKTQLSPSFTRFTFHGEGVQNMLTHAPDQWIKLFIPDANGHAPKITSQEQYKSLDAAQRPPMRTYTVRHLRPELHEMDIDFVIHGDEGPASAWAIKAKIGDVIQMRAHCHSVFTKPAGCIWLPPQNTTEFLLIADETAIPAAIGILEALSQYKTSPKVTAYLEVPHKDDRLDTPVWPELELNWLVRKQGSHQYNQLLIDAAEKLELPNHDNFYAWIAGETAAIRHIRLHLTDDKNLNKESLAFQGYWKLGQAQ